MISVVIPSHNEEEAVGSLHAELVKVLSAMGNPFEIIWVDDGSTDRTYEKLSSLSPVTIIQFRRRFGQTAAMDAGIKQAKGEYIVTMDGDGQNDPADIPRLVDALEQGSNDLIAGWRKYRKDPFMKKISSRAAAIVRSIILHDGIHDSGCSLKIYKRECFENVDLTGEMHRFIPAILATRGFRVGELTVNHRPRAHGETKYTWSRGIKGLLDMVAVFFWRVYANRPLHLFGGVGVVLIVFSALAGLFATYEKFVFGVDLSNNFLATLSVFGILTGIQLLVAGLLADMVAKLYVAQGRSQAYTIKDVITR
ncbi:MAG: glycosyltransferase family 2 protein [Patescibacteria group bacterium]|nr:glycosyltransferase family 2 protein [Patescibacteria group bacterium]